MEAIKAQDVRIGNHLKHKESFMNKAYGGEGYWTVTKIGAKSFQCKGHRGISFEPIPLTE